MNARAAAIGVLGSLVCCALAGAAERPLGFEEALDRILERSTAVASQRATTDAAHARTLPYKLVFLPSLAGTAQRTNYSTFGNAVDGDQFVLQAQLNLFHFGSDYYGLKSSLGEEGTQRALLESQVLTVEDQGVQALAGEIEAQGEVEVNRKLVGLQETSMRIARERYARGYLARQEADKVEVDLENARARLADAESRMAAAQGALEPLLGPATIELRWPWKDKLAHARAGSAFPPQADLEARPDWRAADLRVDTESDKMKSLRGLIWPSLDSSLSYGYGDGFYAIGLPSGQFIQGLITLTIPLFDHLTAYSNTRAQGYVLSAAEQNQEQVRRNARGDYEAARSQYEIAISTALAREGTLALSRRIYDDSQRRFRGGRVSADELALDQNRLLSSELLAVQGWSAVHVAFAHLCHSIGKRVAQCLAMSSF